MKKHRTSQNPHDSLRRRVYDYITTEMDKGNYSPGSYIRINTLAEEMGISKTPLREAMIKLEAEGLVTIYPRQGVIVNKFDLEDSRYLFTTIGSLESEMVAMNFTRFTRTMLATMRTQCVCMRNALEQDEFSHFNTVHWDFHQMFLELADNIFAERILTPIKIRLWDFPRRGFSKRWLLMACDEHEAIVDAIEAQDLSATVFLIKERHWSFTYNESFIRKTYFPSP